MANFEGGAFGGMSFKPLGWDNGAFDTIGGGKGDMGLGSPTSPLAPTNTASVPKLSSLTGVSGNAGGGAGIDVTSLPGSAQNVTINQAPDVEPVGGTAGACNAVESYFVRFIVVVLGFVFVAAGLHGFASGTIRIARSP